MDGGAARFPEWRGLQSRGDLALGLAFADIRFRGCAFAIQVMTITIVFAHGRVGTIVAIDAQGALLLYADLPRTAVGRSITLDTDALEVLLEALPQPHRFSPAEVHLRRLSVKNQKAAARARFPDVSITRADQAQALLEADLLRTSD